MSDATHSALGLIAALAAPTNEAAKYEPLSPKRFRGIVTAAVWDHLMAQERLAHRTEARVGDGGATEVRGFVHREELGAAVATQLLDVARAHGLVAEAGDLDDL